MIAASRAISVFKPVGRGLVVMNGHACRHAAPMGAAKARTQSISKSQRGTTSDPDRRGVRGYHHDRACARVKGEGNQHMHITLRLDCCGLAAPAARLQS